MVAASPDDYLSTRGKAVLPDGIRGLFPLETPERVSFLAGKPNPETFPFESITLHLKPPLETGNAVPLDSDAAEAGVDLELSGRDMWEALQYGPTSGLPRLVSFLTELTTQVHNRPLASPEPLADGSLEVPWRISVGNGCQDLLMKAFQTLLNPGDPILVETPVYAGVLSQLQTLELEMTEVEVDDNGLSATALDHVLANWPQEKKRPKVLYTVPVGSNPTGCSCPVDRKLEVLQVCKKYGVFILEDDPYYYLATELIPSYFAVEKQIILEGGQVARFDSFSKLLSAGMRMAFAAGPTWLINAMDKNTSAANLQPNSLAMGVALKLLNHWGIKGFREHGERVANFYASRRDQFEAIAHKHLDGLATWVSPVAGMFLWLDLSPIKDTHSLIMNEALAKGVLAVPGFSFFPNPRESHHVRVSFSIVDMDAAEIGFKALAEAIREARAQLSL